MDFQKEAYTVLSRLHVISRELNVPFDDGKVIGEYSKKFGGIKKEIQCSVINPIYFPSDECVGHPVYNERGEFVSVTGKNGETIYGGL